MRKSTQKSTPRRQRDTFDSDQRQARLRMAAAVGGFVLLCALLLVILPATSPVSLHPCNRFAFACRADAHAGVLGLFGLVLAALAGAFAYLTLRGEASEQRRRERLEAEEKARFDERYDSLAREMLYETLHNLFHLIEAIEWDPPPPGPQSNEYDGCSLSDWPVCNFRYTERILDVPFVEELHAESAPVVAFLDHALRNARFIDLNSSSPDGRERVVKQVVWLAEHLLRVLVSARYRSKGESRIAAAAAMALGEAKLDDVLPAPALTDDARKLGPERELRDRVRLVRLHRPTDGRELDTEIALFTPDGTSTALRQRFKAMQDPPPRR
jgi:hypothetical protein